MSAVSRITNRSAIARLLDDQPVENADLLGYLDPGYAEACTWWGRTLNGALDTLVLVYDGLSRPGLFTAGNAGGVRPILRDAGRSLPQRVTGHYRPSHREPVLTAFRDLGRTKHMTRMVLQRENAALQDDGRAVRLTHADTAQIMRLYGHWPDHFFEPFQLESGLYFGIRAEGELVCIAGIHNLSKTYDVATIGNLVTHPEHRGRGYASSCTERLVRETFAHVSRVTLDVEAGNEPAMRTFGRLGFREQAAFFEGELALLPQG